MRWTVVLTLDDETEEAKQQVDHHPPEPGLLPVGHDRRDDYKYARDRIVGDSEELCKGEGQSASGSFPNAGCGSRKFQAYGLEGA